MSGTWYVRHLCDSGYVKARLGEADDTIDGGGREIQSFADAQRRALREELPLRARARTQGLTVADVLSDCQQQRAKIRSPQANLQTTAQVRLVADALGDRSTTKLSTPGIEAWRDSVSNSRYHVGAVPLRSTGWQRWLHNIRR